MSLGPFCEALKIDEGVLNGERSVTCDPKSITNGVIWELRKYKVAKKLTTKDVLDWLVKICDLKCEDSEKIQNELNEKIEKVANFRSTFLRAPKKYPDEVDRLMKWEFEFPSSMGVEPAPVFEPVVRASLGPKLLKVLKEKAAADDDSMDVSGPSDDDDEQAKRRKAREEIIQLKKDLTWARKTITNMNDSLNDLSKRYAFLSDLSTSITDRRRMKADIEKLKAEWNSFHSAPGGWHECIERLNHVNSNKSDYMDVGYMIRRNKKQGIFDELNVEFEKTLEEFKNKVVALEKERRSKKKNVGRENRQKGKSDRKRTRQESEGADFEEEDSKKICLSEEVKEEASKSLSVEDFMKSEKVEKFKNRKYANAIRAIYTELTSMSVHYTDIHEILFTLLDTLEKVNADKIPAELFAGNIYMEARMFVLLQVYSDLSERNEIGFSNIPGVKYDFVDTSYQVTVPGKPTLFVGVLDISGGSPDTSLSFLKDAFGQLITTKVEGVQVWDNVVKAMKELVGQHLISRNLIEILFLYKQNILPSLKKCVYAATNKKSLISLSSAKPLVPDELIPKIKSLNNFCSGLYFLTRLAELTDTVLLGWELLSQNTDDGNDDVDATKISQSLVFSKALQQVYSFCEALDSREGSGFGKELSDFLRKDKKLSALPFAPHRASLFNIVFHNTAGLWFLHEVGLITEFFEKIKDKDVKSKMAFDPTNEKLVFSIARALGLIGKLVAVPLWTALEDNDVDVGQRYTCLIEKVQKWASDASEFMKGKDALFDDVPVTNDAVYVSLIKGNGAHDAVTKEILEITFYCFISYIKASVYIEKMPDVNGETSAEDEQDDDRLDTCGDFETFDRISTSVQSFPFYFKHSLCQFAANSGKKVEEYFPHVKSKSMQKIDEVKQRHAKKLLKSLYKRKIKIAEMKSSENDKAAELSKIQWMDNSYRVIDELVKYGGLWRSVTEVDERFKDLRETDRMNALKAQIRFRRDVLHEVHEGGLLDLAKDGQGYSCAKLIENLKTILRNECRHHNEANIYELASATDDEAVRNKIYESCRNAKELDDGPESVNPFIRRQSYHWLLGKIISHTIFEYGRKEELTGVCIARKKIDSIYSYYIRYDGKDCIYKISENKVAEDYKNQNLRLTEPEDEDFLGAHLSIAFIKDDGNSEWYDCRVVNKKVTGNDFVVEFDFYGSDRLDHENEEVPEVQVLTFSTRLLDHYLNDRLRFL